ncbi:MAG: biotin--[acetyl-CoA-carboxylase] ligase [Puniceicoccales bacterium]|nr:biotin--[acetyl-CoA-carboxylase] ligase [Puniceicoccales bacterium]
MRVDAEAYRSRLEEICSGKAAVFFSEETGSTSADAKAMLGRGERPPFVAVAIAQTAAYGQRGRTWISNSAGNLCFSYALPVWDALRNGIGIFAQHVAVEICGMLRAKFSVHAQVKWPNDIFVGKRKIGGLLLEVVRRGEEISSAVLGVGQNIMNAPSLDGSAYGATCLRDVSPSAVDFVDAAAGIIGAVFGAAECFGGEDAESFCGRWNAFDCMGGETVAVRTADGLIRGTNLGIGSRGELIIGGADGKITRVIGGDARIVLDKK